MMSILSPPPPHSLLAEAQALPFGLYTIRDGSGAEGRRGRKSKYAMLGLCINS